MLNALLVEDNLDLANTIVQYLELENISCDHASNGVSGLHFMQQQHYHVLLLDINLPRLDGLSVCQQLRNNGNDTPILMLTARDQLQDKIDGFRAGTDDYLVKPFELSELVVRVQALSKRRSGQSQVLRCGDLVMHLNEREVMRNGHAIKLSPTNWRLLETLLRASPAVVSRKILESTIWGDDLPDSNSLKVHLHHLRKSVDKPFPTALIQTIAGHGFAIRADTDKRI